MSQNDKRLCSNSAATSSRSEYVPPTLPTSFTFASCSAASRLAESSGIDQPWFVPGARSVDDGFLIRVLKASSRISASTPPFNTGFEVDPNLIGPFDRIMGE